MVPWLPSFPYPQARPDEGYWGPVSSTINWCEEDYYATIYSAEIVNTLTNLLFIALGVKGIRNVLAYGHDEVFLVAFAGYFAVGVGSFLFHSTLKYSMQLVDELSMIYTACLMAYATFSYLKSRLFRQILAGGLFFLAIFITCYYHYLQDPSFHQNAFALLTTAIILRSMYIMEAKIRPAFRAKYGSSARGPQGREDLKIMKSMWIMIAVALSIFLLGFGIWALDNKYCPMIRKWRREVGLPWGVLLEGHGWWHLMTGVGSYYYIIWGIWLRRCLNHQEQLYQLHWPSIFMSLPEVVPRFPRSAEGEAGRELDDDRKSM